MGARLRRIAPAAVIGVVALALVSPITARATGHQAAEGDRRGQPPTSTVTDASHVGELVAGTARYLDGTYVWTDYAYDDRGPDSDTRPGGDATYPEDMSPNNVADLIQLQVAAAGDGLAITAVLETLTEATTPLVGVAFDLDPAAGAPALPGSWAPRDALGVDTLAVLGNGSGQLWRVEGGEWTRDDHDLAVQADPVANTLHATLPVALPASGSLRTVAVAGYEHAGSSWLEGTAPVHDLAFVRGEDPTTPYVEGVASAIANFASGGDTMWQDYRQSAILAGAEDPAGAVATIDVAKLRAGHTDPPPTLAKGFHTFLYRSELDLGEGIQGSGNSALFAGPYQPYLVWVPGGATEGLPLVVYLHGSSQTHLSAVNTSPYDRRSQDPVLGLPDAFFDHFEAVVAWPLGRGPQQWYQGASELDVLDVHDDVVDRLALNADRVMLAGLSMGGIGTFRLAELYPDRWSLAYSDVGYDRDIAFPENLTALPVRFQNGAPDYLVHVNNALATRDLLEAAGTVDYRSYILHQRHHQPAVALAECIYQGAFGTDRVTDPAHVRYAIDPAHFDPDLGLVYDGAYWVDGMRSAGGKASVDVVSRAFGHLPDPQPSTQSVRENLTAGRDFCGENEAVRTDDTWDEKGRVVERADIAPEPHVEGALTNLETVTIHADRAGVSTGTLSLASDRPAMLTLAGLAPGTAVTTGSGTATASHDGTATVALVAGDNTVVVGCERAGRAERGRAPCRHDRGPGDAAEPPAGSAVATPTVEGPIGPEAGQGLPFHYQPYELGGLGYAEEEYFLSGTARTITGEEAPYTTRILVYRPLDPGDFNGTMVIEWDNVTQQFGIPFVWNWLHPMVYRDGYAYAFVAAQSAEQCGNTVPTGGVELPATGVCNPLQLKGWDPERYESLRHPGDDWSFDIFSQVAKAVGGGFEGDDPMARLEVEQVIATGNSQSASRLSTYVREVQPRAGVIDGFLIDAGGSKDYPQDPAAPVIHVQSEAELSPADPTPWPNYRLWEIAGGSHGDHDHTTHPSTYGRPEKLDSSAETDLHAHEEYGQHGPSAAALCAPAAGGNQFPRRYSQRAALDHLDRWARTGDGSPVPQPDRVRFDADGNPLRDEHGNVLGGLRLPPIEVPVATYLGDSCGLLGSTLTFDPVRLALLYADHEDYVTQMRSAIETAVQRGFLLDVDGRDLLRLAEASPVGTGPTVASAQSRP